MRANRWLMLGVLFVARLVLGYQFQTAGSLAPFLVQDLALDYAQIGTLIGVFILPGLAVSIPSGFVTRWFGDKNLILVGMALMVIGGVFAGVSDTYSAILLARGLSGVGGAILTVVMSKMVIDWFIDKELFIALAIFIVGWPAGIAVAQATQTRIADALSWHSVFFFSSALVALAFTLIVQFYHLPPSSKATDSEKSKITRWEVAMACLAGAVWMFFNAAYFVVVSFGPAHLVERGMAVTEAATLVSVMSWEFILVLPLGGWIATRFNVANVVMFGALGTSVVCAALIPLSTVPLLTFVVFGFALALATPAMMALAAEVLGARTRGSGLGIYYLWYFGGTPVLVSLAGLLNKQSGSATTSLYLASVMMGCALLLVSAFRLAQLVKFNHLCVRRLPI